MTSKWWDLAFGIALPVLSIVAWVSYPGTATSQWGSTAVLAALLICYFVFGRGAHNDPRFSVPFVIVLILSCCVSTALCPSMATLQALAIPYLWSVLPKTSHAITMNVVLVAGVTAGFLVSLGVSEDGVAQAGITEGLSLLFSISLGLWISHVISASEEHGRLLSELQAVQKELAVANHDAGAASERERLAREIHDTIAQSLTSLVMLAQRAHGELDHGTASEPLLGDSLDLIESTARDALTEARSLVTALSPLPEGGSTLADVIERLTARFERETGVQMSASVEASALPRDLEVVLLRCSQEGLANVRKHAQATKARLTITREHDLVNLSVHDNGRGFTKPEATSRSGFGIVGMRDRLALVGGHLVISSEPGIGTNVTVSIPLKEEVMT